MIDKSAIDRIVELGATAEIHNGDGAHVATITPDGTKLVGLEQFLDRRIRYRGSFITESIGAFVSYLGPFADGDNPQPVFIDAERAAAHCVLDLGTNEAPGHCEHSASLTLRQTAAWAAMLAINDVAQSQRALAEWLEDWRAIVTARGADNVEMNFAKAIAAIRKIDIDATTKVGTEVANLSESRSQFARIEASSSEGIPSRFQVKCKPYEELGERIIDLDISVTTGGKEPMLKLRIVSFGALVEAIAEEFSNVISGATDRTFRPLIGKFTPGRGLTT